MGAGKNIVMIALVVGVCGRAAAAAELSPKPGVHKPAAHSGRPASTSARKSRHAERPGTIEIITFGGERGRVRIVRGGAGLSDAALAHDAVVVAAPAERPESQLVAFADPHQPTVTVLRGIAVRLETGLPEPGTEIGLFAPAGIAALDRVAFAVDGAESSHGRDPAMWRPEADGPQGPMQVSAAAATDVGGGDRFDLSENRMLGRAYLERLYRRYGNWPDAVAAYNWGPSNMDWWIGNGRPIAGLPLEVERYRDRVLRDTALSEPGSPMLPR